jgi:lysophospholipase L1-like esterase
MRLVFLGDCTFGLGPFHDHNGPVKMINFGFMRAKIDSIGSMAGGCAGIDDHDTRFLIMCGVSNAIRAHTRKMTESEYTGELEEDLRYLVNQYRWWNILQKVHLFTCLPVKDSLCRKNTMELNNRYVDYTNTMLAKTAAANTIPLHSLDDGLVDNSNELLEDLTTDGLHLNEKGYAILRKNLFQKLQLSPR